MNPIICPLVQDAMGSRSHSGAAAKFVFARSVLLNGSASQDRIAVTSVVGAVLAGVVLSETFFYLRGPHARTNVSYVKFRA